MGSIDETLEGTDTADRVAVAVRYSLILGYRPERSTWTWERAALGERGPITLGRGCELFDSPLRDPWLSRRQARLTLDRGRWVLTDLGSRNGTALNGRRLFQPAPLSPGDLIRLGDTLILFDRSAGDDDSPEGWPVANLLGRSRGIVDVRRAIHQAAPRDQTVLISGETGTGKELVARALHDLSGRRGPFVPVNCVALSDGLLQSELFGHQKGAFTGAVEDRPGLFEAAEGGTLFLDEIGELPPGFQSVLLRVLEDRRVRPLGANREREVDVRIVCATNREVEAMVRDGSFRKDLYARLAQTRIKLPPLRERRADIPLLSRALLDRLGAARRPVGLELAERLLGHSWPLNVRGLLIALDNAVAGSPPDGPLTLTPEVEGHLSALIDPEPTPPPSRPATWDLGEMPSEERLVEVLRENKGRIARSARALGCSRQKIYRWVQAYGLDLEDFRV